MTRDHGLSRDFQDLPAVFPVSQSFEDRRIDDAAAALRKAAARSGLAGRIRPGTEVAITAGSRGIDRFPEILREAGDLVRDAGAVPFVVPAMGSHGGATAEGQRRLLAGLGITEESVSMPIRSSMDTVEVARTESGTPVVVDRLAAGAGGILVINRVKPHTSIMEGPHHSGIAKMLVVGLGKRDAAAAFHRLGPVMMAGLLPAMARELLGRLPVLGGIGLVEDARDHLAEIRAAGPEDFLDMDRELLETAASLMPRLPFEEIDVLVVDEVGKDISGTGMDANVVGRRCMRLTADPASPRITRIAALALSEGAGGNAHGIAMADFITEGLARRIDWMATLENAMATQFPEKARLPIALPDEKQAVQAALATCWVEYPARARLVRIKNTRELAGLLVTAPLLDEVKANPSLELDGPARPLLG
jgi:hypothetical protein